MNADIVIIGAGPAGLCFARSLADTGLNIVIVEQQTKQCLSQPSYDGREIALTHHSQQVLHRLGIWSLVANDEISLIKEARVLNGSAPFALSFDHRETNVENLGFMMSNNVIRKSAYDALMDYGNVQIIDNSKVVELNTQSDRGWVKLDDDRQFSTQLIIAADSRFSKTRQMMGIATDMLDFGRTCIACTMSIEGEHNGTAYECFQYGQTLAVLPLNDNQVSVVVTIDTEQSAALLSMDAADFGADIERRFGRRHGEMKLTSDLFSYPLVATFAKRFHGNRFAVIGDAAVGMHPVTAHGFNLGLRGSDILAREIKNVLKAGHDIANQGPLERYSKKHRRICMPLYHGTNALVRLYTQQSRPAKLARHALLHIARRLPPAKRSIVNQLTEHEPRFAPSRVLASRTSSH